MPADPFLQLLLFVVFPLWLVAGFLDWVCHRRARIEATSGARESLLHLLQLAEMAAVLLLGLAFELSAGVLALVALLLLAHQITAFMDTRYAQPQRVIGALEQQVHGLMEVLPWCALLIVATRYAADWLRPPSFAFQLRAPLPEAHWFALLLGPLGLAALLSLEELFRGLRHAHRASSWLDERLQRAPPSWLDRYLE